MIENDFERHRNEAAVKKLRRVQTELHAPKGQRNEFGGYRYRSCEDILEAVKPLLAKEELTLIISDHIQYIEGRFYIVATATVVDPDTGAAVAVNAYAREAESKKGMDDSQVTGAASSYARKYALNGLFAIDDTKDPDTDAYTAQTRGEAKPKPKQEKPSAAAPVVCADCGKPISDHGKTKAEEIAKGTTNAYGRPLCYECGIKAKAAKKGGEQGA